MSFDDAIARAVEAQLGPQLAQVAELRRALDAWEAAERAAVARAVERTALEALGQPVPPPDFGAQVALDRVRSAAAWLVPAAVAPLLRRESTPEDRERGAALLAEIQTVKIEQEPYERRAPLLQAWAAEARLIMAPLSPESALYHELYDVLGRLVSVRKRAAVSTFIEGLSLARSADFERLAFRARQDLAEMDRPTKPAAPSLKAPLALLAGRKR